MVTFKDILADDAIINENAIVEISDKSWSMGSLTEIKEQVSQELFIAHIGINMLGGWKGEGWGGIISEQTELVPYLGQTLDAFSLYEMKVAFETVVAIFPDFTVFSNADESFCDIINFLQNVRFRVSDARLDKIPKETRSKMVQAYHNGIDHLDNISEQLWGDNTPYGGWKIILGYIDAKRR